MTEFTDEAYVLNTRAHGESGAIVHVLTQGHGVFAAHVAGGASRRMRAVLQPGSNVVFGFRARHAEQLGSATLEPNGPTPDLLDDPLALAGLQCACAMTRAVLPEREPHPGAFLGLAALMAVLEDADIWPAVYVRYEAGLLENLGFGLDLSACAVTGSREDLVYVSPKSARAVSRQAGAPYHDKLLVLPPFLLSSQGGLVAGDVENGLALTGFFLERHVFHPHDRPLPEVRTRMADALRQASRL